MVEVEREVVKARIGGNATLKCKSQAFPPSENFWTLTSHEPISSGEETFSQIPYIRYLGLDIIKSSRSHNVSLTIHVAQFVKVESPLEQIYYQIPFLLS